MSSFWRQIRDALFVYVVSIFVVSAILVYGMVKIRDIVTAGLAKQMKQNAEQVKLLESQAKNSMTDRAFIHQEVEGNKKYAAHLVEELNQMRAALKRLEARK